MLSDKPLVKWIHTNTKSNDRTLQLLHVRLLVLGVLVAGTCDWPCSRRHLLRHDINTHFSCMLCLADTLAQGIVARPSSNDVMLRPPPYGRMPVQHIGNEYLIPDCSVLGESYQTAAA